MGRDDGGLAIADRRPAAFSKQHSHGAAALKVSAHSHDRDDRRSDYAQNDK